MKAEIGNDLEKAARLLQDGELVAIPTETVYGLAANALNEKAVAKIFEAKRRPFFDPLILHIRDATAIHDFAREVPSAARKLAEHFWPGPLTLVLPKKPIVPDLVTSGHDTVALRVPAHPLTLALLNLLPFPLAAPSANPFGYVSPTRASHVADQLGNEVAYILDGGPSSIGLESTIIGFEGNLPVVLRLGGTALEAIEEITSSVQRRLNQSSNPSAPGQLLSHYAPHVPVIVGDIEKLIDQYKITRVGVLSFFKSYPLKAHDKAWILSPKADLHEAATHLFGALREADQSGISVLLAEIFPDEGLGRAINDRLQRASKR